MSALTKPMIHSTRAIGTDANPLNAEKITSFTKLTIPKIPNGSGNTFAIVFSMEAGSNPASIEWRYDLEADRDTDFAAVLVLVSTVAP